MFTPDVGFYTLPSIALHEATDTRLVAFTGNGGSVGSPAAAYFTRSVAGGSWSLPQPLSGPASMGSSLVLTPDGRLVVAWADLSTDAVQVSRSLDLGGTFDAPSVAAAMNDNLGLIPLGWVTAGGIWRGYPWYHVSPTGAPNFPALAVDKSSGPNRGSLYLVWADHAEGAIAPAAQTASDVASNNSPDTPQHLQLDTDVFGIVSCRECPRNTSDFYTFDLAEGESVWLGGESFYDPLGVTFSGSLADGRIERFGTFIITNDFNVQEDGLRGKPIVFTAPRTGRYRLQVDTFVNTTQYLLKVRRYTPSATSASRDMRDIVLVRSTDGGVTWSPKVRVNHDASGHDQCLPNVAVDERGTVYVAWYDRRHAPFGDSVDTYASVSHDGGRTFGPDLRLSSRSGAWLQPPNVRQAGDRIGDRIAIAAGDMFAMVAWMDFRDWPENADVRGARILDLPTATDAVSDFSAEALASGVRLRWLVNDARSVSALRVYRSEGSSNEIALSDGDLMPAGDGRTEWIDPNAQPGRTYDYRLRIVSSGGTHWLGPVRIEVPQRISALAWRAAWPNPFARRTSVKLAVPRAAQGSVRVYDVQGKEVATLAEGAFEPGERTIEWDGRDAAGGVAAPGLYFVAAQVGSESVRMRVARVP
ncbi:MAG: hypothetical protein K8R56_01835 [Candidatus Eisenbacteria bacterium]|nr:hypothetical protein [Candidatus Eisenbacteria bacterium]